MSPEEYAAAQAALSAATARYVSQFSRFFTRPALAVAEWLNLLQLLFPEVKRQREESADLARRFYDYQRAVEHPNLPRNDRFLEDYRFEWFVENMDPARKRMSLEDSPRDALTNLTMRAVREVENAGRKQIIHAVQNDPEPRILRGWARVATGRETCAWCLMLVSRGPVYMAADTAGLDLDDTSAIEALNSGDLAEIEEHMEEWHTGCDCKVVPVFKQEGWVGQEAAARALDLWNEATREAVLLEDLGIVKRSGPNKGEPLTRNELAINALRRRLDNGEISSFDFAALAA